MGAASLALFYAGFACLFVSLGLFSLQLSTLSDINAVVSQPMEEYPFTGPTERARRLNDIDTPADLHRWLANVVKTVVYSEQTPKDKLTQEQIDSNATNFATIGSFNRVLLLRFTAKRRTLEVNKFGTFRASGGREAFKNEYPKRLSGPVYLAYDQENAMESKEKFCGDDEDDACYTWTREGSYEGAGGYSFFLDPAEGPEVYMERLDEWLDAGFFDLRMATFVLDLMTYNVNNDFFLHRGWAFTFDFAGNCETADIVRGFNLNSFNTSKSRYLNQYILRIVLWIFVALFIIHEFMKMWSLGLYQHFRHKGAWVDALSLLMCIIVLLSYRVLEGRRVFHEFEFEHLFDESRMQTEYDTLSSVGREVEELHYLTAVNLLLVFARAVVLVAELQSNFGLILEVLDASSSTLTYFLVMFLMIMAGFVLLGYFIFGSGYYMFSNPILALYTTFSMLSGEDVLDKLMEVDEPMAYMYYYMFFVLFYLVFINVFVSILMAGYDIVITKIKESEDSPLTKLMDEFKHEFLDRILSWGRVLGGFMQRSPMVDSVIALACCCVPTGCTMPSVGRFCSRIRAAATGGDDADKRVVNKHHAAKNKDHRSGWAEILCTFALWVNTVCFLALQVRGEACFETAQAVVTQPLEEKWVNEKAYGVEDFSSIKTFEQVRQWSHLAIEGLYKKTKCAVSKNASYTLLPTGGPEGCNNTQDDQQLVQIINNWNIGFMNTTFVRLTIQPACFVPPSQAKWEKGFPFERMTPDIACAADDCSSVLAQYNCQSPDGTSISPGGVQGSTGFDAFTPPNTKLGSYQLRGGFVNSLGTTQQEAQQILTRLYQDNWFTSRSASMVFDWITYNGNLDMFTYTRVSFSLMGTGTMTKNLLYSTFPMNIAEGGGPFAGQRTAILILFSAYMFQVLLQCLELAHRFNGVKKGRRLIQGITIFFSDWWNLSDSVSLVMAILTVVYYLLFALLPFTKEYKFSIDSRLRFTIPNQDEMTFGMVKSVDPMRYLEEDWYIFRQFERAEALYTMFLTVSGINNFLIAIKTSKYVGQMKAVSIFSSTLDSGKSRNVYFAVVNMLLMCGFALFFHIIFGKSVHEVATWSQSIYTLFKWMVGDYDLMPYLKQNQPLAAFFFLAFMTIFYYIATNMFLATMLSVYCDTVGKEDEERTRQKYRPRKDVMIHYKDKGAMLDELKPEHFEYKDGDLVVKELPPDSQPASQGVLKGHLLQKINADPKMWKEHCKSAADIFEKLDKMDDGEVRVEFVERARRQERGFLRIFNFLKKSVVDDDEDEVGLTPTCKNFWRKHGAIACISEEVTHLENAEEGDEDGEHNSQGGIEEEDDQAQEESGSEEEAPGRKASEAVKKARRRMRTKKRLDALLFSRWSDGKPHRGADGAVGTGMGWDSFGGTDDGSQPKEVQYEVDHMEVFQLKEEMNRLPIAGQEAWLDCLVSYIEREMDDESIVTEVLRTSEMQDVVKNKQSREQKPLQEFYRHADEVLKMLEYKANKKYYQYLQIESEQRQELLRSQNEVLHDYVCELETEFSKVMELIHKNRAKKEVMLTKLAGLLDRSMYRHLDPQNGHMGRQSMARPGAEEDDDKRKPPLHLV